MAFLNEVRVDEYRGIKSLHIDGLKQVNLVVGDNNCGKTSVLEAIQLLGTSGSLASIYRVSRQRSALSIVNSESPFDSFLCMFPRGLSDSMRISVSSLFGEKELSFELNGEKGIGYFGMGESASDRYEDKDQMRLEMEGEVFKGDIVYRCGDELTKNSVDINQYSKIGGVPLSDNKKFDIVYVSPFEHLSGRVISGIIRNEGYKQVCLKAVQLFDPDIEDMMVYPSDVKNRPVEYIRHSKTGDMPISTYGDGVKKVLVLSNGIARAAGGILLIDEIETSIHKRYYDDIFRFIVKACKSFDVQVFVTTHSLEAIDGLLATQDYESQKENDDICVCTLKRTKEKTLSRVLAGREVYENREEFGFEVRL